MNIIRSMYRRRTAGLVRAINEASAVTRMVSACNVAFDAKTEWTVVKYGVYPNPRGLQVLDREAAQRIHAAFNSKLNQLANAFRGEPLYVGHPDDEEWRRANPGVRMEAVGRLREVRVGDDGLHLKFAYNDSGQRLIGGDAPAYTSFSPSWGMIPITYQGRKAFRPVEIISVGLTNNPQIPGTFIGLNEALPNETSTSSPMKLKIIALLAALGRPVANPTAVTDEQLESAVNEAVPVATQVVADAGKLTLATNEVATLKNQLTAVQAQVTTAVNEAAGLKTTVATERAARAEIVITRAINEGRLAEAGRAEWRTKFTAQGADFAAIETELGKLAKAINTDSKANIGNRRGQPIDQAKTRAVNEAVTAKQEAMKCDRITAYNSVRAEKPELFATT